MASSLSHCVPGHSRGHCLQGSYSCSLGAQAMVTEAPPSAFSFHTAFHFKKCRIPHSALCIGAPRGVGDGQRLRWNLRVRPSARETFLAWNSNSWKTQARAEQSPGRPSEAEGGAGQRVTRRDGDGDGSRGEGLADWVPADMLEDRAKDRVWDWEKPQVYFFAVANAQSLVEDGALLEEVLSDAISRAQRGRRPRDVWLVMEPAFLDHPKLKGLKNALRPPTAAILSTNEAWMLSVVRELLPQATIGKFVAPTPSLPNPFASNLETGGAVIGGGTVWH